MSKELEYEFNNFANLLHKDCMNLMECLKKQSEDNKPILYLGKHYEKVILPYEEYKKMCNRLEAIDNSNPSEALECLNKLTLLTCNIEWYKDNINTIKKYILKAQEQKQYLKWEDLEFKNYGQYIDVLLNGNKYSLTYYTDEGDIVRIYKEDKNILLLNGKYAEDKQLFNDLHLERVEE